MTSLAERRLLKLQAQVNEFNATVPVGSLCRFWSGVKEGPGKISKTRCRAEVFCGHTAVVWFECGGGCIALSHVEPCMQDGPVELVPVGKTKKARKG